MRRNTRLKTSITLPRDIVEKIDKAAGSSGNRSAFIERAVREYLEASARRARDERDREIIDRNAARLNREAAEVLEFQADL